MQEPSQGETGLRLTVALLVHAAQNPTSPPHACPVTEKTERTEYSVTGLAVFPFKILVLLSAVFRSPKSYPLRASQRRSSRWTFGFCSGDERGWRSEFVGGSGLA